MGQYYHEDLLGSTYRRREEVLEDFLRRCPDDLRVEEDRLVLRYGGAAYPIAGIRERYVGGEEVVRYYLKDGTYFERWTEHGKLIPPWMRGQHQLSDQTKVYLKEGIIEELIKSGHQKTGSYRGLSRELERMGEKVSPAVFWAVLRGRQEGVSVKTLRTLSGYLGVEIDRSDIEAVGAYRSIKNPKLPFDLSSPAGVRLVARAMSDGFLWYRGESFREPHFRYTTDARDRREEGKSLRDDLREVFGEIECKEKLRELDRGVWFEVYTSIVGGTLMKAGAPTGRKAEANPPVPQWVKVADRSRHREWLRRAFTDEGTARTYLGLTRSRDAMDLFTREQVEWLKENLDWREHKSGAWKGSKYVNVTEGLMSDLWSERPDIAEGIIKSEPSLLEDEHELLEDSFGINAEAFPLQLYCTKDGRIRTAWRLRIGHVVDMERFREEVGFSLERKQKDLEDLIRKKRGR